MQDLTKITLEDHRDFLVYREGSGYSVELYDIVVNTERREGKGRKLVEMLKDILKAREEQHHRIHLIFAITREDNRIAREFYEAIGFHLMTLIPYFYEDGERHAVMYGIAL